MTKGVGQAGAGAVSRLLLARYALFRLECWKGGDFARAG